LLLYDQQQQQQQVARSQHQLRLFQQVPRHLLPLVMLKRRHNLLHWLATAAAIAGACCCFQRLRQPGCHQHCCLHHCCHGCLLRWLACCRCLVAAVMHLLLLLLLLYHHLYHFFAMMPPAPQGLCCLLEPLWCSLALILAAADSANLTALHQRQHSHQLPVQVRVQQLACQQQQCLLPKVWQRCLLQRVLPVAAQPQIPRAAAAG
jgi:hypothetical protein